MREQLATVLSVLTLLANGVYGHNICGILLVNGTASPEWKYVREVAPLEGNYGPDYPYLEYYRTVPQMDLTSLNVTCGRNAFDYAKNTETADVLAGSEVGFRVSADYQDFERGVFVHTGPGMIYLSKLPEDVPDLEDYPGHDGDWFKIAYAGPKDRYNWSLRGTSDFNFTIAETTPPGKYLMRIEQFWPTSDKNYNQWFVNCAHVNIVGPGGGTPTGFARFPGTYSNDDPGIHIPRSQEHYSGLPDENINLLEYQPPGPAIWTG